MTSTSLPTGTVTFFFSDVEDSTGLLQRMAADYKDVLERHAAIVRACLAEHSGVLSPVRNTGAPRANSPAGPV